MPPHSPLFPLDGIRDNAVTAGGLALDRRFPCPYSTKNCKGAPPKIKRNQTIGKNRYKWRWKISKNHRKDSAAAARSGNGEMGRQGGGGLLHALKLTSEATLKWSVYVLGVGGSHHISINGVCKNTFLQLTCSFIENRSFSQISEITYRQKHDMFMI